ncbi:hypothetical protein BW730_16935 [Tessaracoccus aquimaris]|uniref:Uncharacterized protein n=1 Tax=Tessaracoccus aquimaris TaxID=1332264 RepID=A0A1Q2CS45_9ACTN|nr:hypothetical protein BW730_16935 [Tessaracoccus aquimaris]
MPPPVKALLAEFRVSQYRYVFERETFSGPVRPYSTGVAAGWGYRAVAALKPRRTQSSPATTARTPLPDTSIDLECARRDT